MPRMRRYTGRGIAGTVVGRQGEIHGVAHGQFCVVYDEQHHRCFGSGEIEME